MSEDRIESGKIPDQKELEKELNEYLGKKYGDRVKLVVPMLFPKADRDRTSRTISDNEQSVWVHSVICDSLHSIPNVGQARRQAAR